MTFQHSALFVTAIWLLIVGVKYRRSTAVLVGGLVGIGLYTVVSVARGAVLLDQLGVRTPGSWIVAIGFTLIWLALMLACGPAADKLAGRFFAKPPTLQAFRAIQESKAKLIAGIVVAWALGGILEELVFRGIVLRTIELILISWISVPAAAGIAIVIAALGAGLIHYYQGPRAMLIITQLSMLFGVFFVITGYNLILVMICHGLYDTIAFIRFANKKSKYSNLDAGSQKAAAS